MSMKRLTRKQVEACGGVYTLDHTDSRGVNFVLKVFTMGNMVTVRVYGKKGTLLYHFEAAPRTWKEAVDTFHDNARRIQDEDDHIHVMFARKCEVPYTEVKKAVEEWIVQHERPMTPGDAQVLADRWENRSLAMQHVYTAACAFENAPMNCDFAKRHNFRVDFRI